MAIRSAAMNGHLEVVKELMRDNRVDASAKNNDAVRSALLNGHISVVKELIKDPRVNDYIIQEGGLEYQIECRSPMMRGNLV